MTDIRNDFEAWCSFNCIIPSPARFEAYQAGRAHGAEELIAKIEKLFMQPESPSGMAYNSALNDCQVIIRKHFGKE